jgi:co-chaperonin GroES (HSP10)
MDDIYFADPMELFCEIIDGEIHMLNDYVLVEPILEPEENYMRNGIMIKPNAENLSNEGILRHVPDHGTICGVKPGDKVFFTNNSNYELEVEGTKYYCMKLHRDVPYRFNEDGTITVLTRWGLIKPEVEENWQKNDYGFFNLLKNDNKRHIGVIYKLSSVGEEVEEGERVIFDRREFLSTEIDGEKYYCVDTKQDIILSYPN